MKFIRRKRTICFAVLAIASAIVGKWAFTPVLWWDWSMGEPASTPMCYLLFTPPGGAALYRGDTPTGGRLTRATLASIEEVESGELLRIVSDEADTRVRLDDLLWSVDDPERSRQTKAAALEYSLRERSMPYLAPHMISASRNGVMKIRYRDRIFQYTATYQVHDNAPVPISLYRLDVFSAGFGFVMYLIAGTFAVVSASVQLLWRGSATR